ncbi:hypothetical protein ACVITL_004645 [Rhizobium pisi]|jgi:hypothetical protein|uniref:Uncharacterized protein n=1 Tax=Rhizobium leguminosarum bv. trifolii TaxID=386 RepID=A0A1C9HVL0_RHILT|nr:hypothetical protein [Rhizobium leguminosarum bv. trifolii]
MLDRGEASLASAVRKRHARTTERIVNDRKIVVGVDFVRG